MKNYEYVISACLCGMKCRYDAVSKANEACVQAVEAGIAIPICPEIMGGLKTPRKPCEIVNGCVRNSVEQDVHKEFLCGANQVLEIVKLFGLRKAVLKDGSPSCGSTEIYDGTFSGNHVKGEGITASLLRRHGIEVMNETEFAAYIAK